jgi:hypothetical protein
MSRPIVSLPLSCLLLAVSASSQAEVAMSDPPPAIAWYALLIVVFALVIGIGVLVNRREDLDDTSKARVVREGRARTRSKPRVQRNARPTKEFPR